MKKRTLIIPAMVLVCVLALNMVSLASGGVAIDWWVMAGGGAPSAEGGVTMNGSLGQPVIGHSGGEGVVLEAGYWVINPQYVVYLPEVLR